LVLIENHKTDGRSRGHPLEHPGKKPDLIGLLPGGGSESLSGFAPVQLALDDLLAQWDVRRTAVDHSAQAGSMGLAKGGQSEQTSKGVAAHMPSLDLRSSHHSCK